MDPSSPLTTSAGTVTVRPLDISLAGMSVAGPVDVTAGSACTVDVFLPGSGGTRHAVQVNAQVTSRVLSAGRFRIGLRFTTLSAEARTALDDCMTP